LERVRHLGAILLLGATATACGSTTRDTDSGTKPTKLAALIRAAPADVSYKTAPFKPNLAFKRRAAEAIRNTSHSEFSSIECPRTLILKYPSKKPIATVLCQAIYKAECTEWLVYSEDHSLRASLWRYSPLNVCRSRS
jgi:hypothetical protein